MELLHSTTEIPNGLNSTLTPSKQRVNPTRRSPAYTSCVKFYFAVVILLKLALATVQRNRNKAAFLRYLWGQFLLGRV